MTSDSEAMLPALAPDVSVVSISATRLVCGENEPSVSLQAARAIAAAAANASRPTALRERAVIPMVVNLRPPPEGGIERLRSPLA